MERERLPVEQRLGIRCSVQALRSTHGKRLTLGEMHHEGKRRSLQCLSLDRQNFSHNRRTRRDSRLDHDQSQKGLHCIGAEVHLICDVLVSYALQQVLQHFLFALCEVELLTDLRQRN